MMTMSVRRVWWNAVAVAALVLPVSATGLQRGAGVDARVMESLLKAAAGTYIVNDGKLEAAAATASVQVLVQMDVSPSSSGAMRVPIAVGASVSEAWTLQMRIEKVGAPAQAIGPEDTGTAGGPGLVRAVREYRLEPGRYEAIVGLARRGSDGRWIGTVVRQPLTVHSMPATELIAGPIVLGEKSEPATAAQAGQPFVFGETRLTPATASRFRQSEDLHVACRIAGWKADTEGRPDLSVEYVFRQITSRQARFFNKTKPQLLNPQTLPKSFSGAAGTVSAGMRIPLAAFPPGGFDLDMRVLDKRTQLSVTGSVRFTVTE